MTIVEQNQDLISFNNSFEKAAKIALILNFSMFFVEIISGFFANSLALISDSFDFLGDSLNYLIAIYVLKKSLRIQSYSSLIKAFSMMIFAIFILFNAYKKYQIGLPVPRSYLMIIISFISLCVNLYVSFLLFKYRNFHSNQKSVWICSRNDAINNFLVIVAGICVFYFSSLIPDLIVASFIAILALFSSFIIFKDVYFELKNSDSKKTKKL